VKGAIETNQKRLNLLAANQQLGDAERAEVGLR
jgi:hypothetical protein